MYKLRLLLPLSGIPTCPLNSVYCCSHLMPNLSLEEAGMDSPLEDASLIASADIAPIPLVYPSADSSLLASVDIAPIPLMYPSADADILASAAIARIEGENAKIAIKLADIRNLRPQRATQLERGVLILGRNFVLVQLAGKFT